MSLKGRKATFVAQATGYTLKANKAQWRAVVALQVVDPGKKRYLRETENMICQPLLLIRKERSRLPVEHISFVNKRFTNKNSLLNI